MRFSNFIGIVLFILILGFSFVLQADNARYFYDELGRLKAEVDSQGNTAVYNYDAVGNILSITRSDVAPTGVSITYFNPEQGTEGTTVEIFGSGFISVPGDNQVDFNGTSATVTSSTATQMVTTVPTGATTGPIQVTNINGSATSGNDFVVTQPITVSVSPANYILAANGTLQLTATVTGTSNTEVLWFVEGLGSISASGLYGGPGILEITAQVNIEARSKEDIQQFGTAIIDLFPSGTLGPIVSSPLSIEIASAAPTSNGPFISPFLSVEIDGGSTTSSGPFVSPSLGVSLTPILSTISPNSALPGTIGLSVTITGTGFSGTTGLSFLLDGNPDSDITVSNIVVNGAGTLLTATFDISGTATSGIRVVRVITPDGTSPPTALEGNGFIVN